MTLTLEDFPRPNFEEMPTFYDELDDLAKRVVKAIRELKPKLFDKRREVILFNKMSEDDVIELIKKDPEAMIPALTKVCGLSVRQFERLYGLKNVYRLRKWREGFEEGDLKKFARAIIDQLGKIEMPLGTFIYTFYKMWEEERKRFYRGKRAEEEVREFFRAHGYDCGKLSEPVEVDAAIPPSPDPKKVLVAIPVRTGVRRDLVKRAKEFSRECDEFRRNFPNVKVVVVFRIPKHELDKREEIREKIAEQRAGMEPYDGIFFQDELDKVIEKLMEWKIPKKTL